jgi:hypothetical protein
MRSSLHLFLLIAALTFLHAIAQQFLKFVGRVGKPGCDARTISYRIDTFSIGPRLALQMIAQLSNGAIHGLLGFDKRRSRLG